MWPRARRKRIEELCAATEPREFILREGTRAYGGLLEPEKRALRGKGEGK